MARRSNQQLDQQSNKVRSLENDYIRSSDHKAQYSRKQKIRFRRRMFVFCLVASAVLVFLISTNINQDKRLAEKEQYKEEVLAKLQEAKDKQEILKLQINKLEDEEYIAKLARKEYFLSDDGEIIFTIPTNGQDD